MVLKLLNNFYVTLKLKKCIFSTEKLGYLRHFIPLESHEATNNIVDSVRNLCMLMKIT